MNCPFCQTPGIYNAGNFECFNHEDLKVQFAPNHKQNTADYYCVSTDTDYIEYVCALNRTRFFKNVKDTIGSTWKVIAEIEQDMHLTPENFQKLFNKIQSLKAFL